MVSAGAAYIRDEGTNVAETVRVKKLATYQAQGQVPLVDVFEGRRQLLVFFHMWHDGATVSCGVELGVMRPEPAHGLIADPSAEHLGSSYNSWINDDVGSSKVARRVLDSCG